MLPGVNSFTFCPLILYILSSSLISSMVMLPMLVGILYDAFTSAMAPLLRILTYICVSRFLKRKVSIGVIFLF